MALAKTVLISALFLAIVVGSIFVRGHVDRPQKHVLQQVTITTPVASAQIADTQESEATEIIPEACMPDWTCDYPKMLAHSEQVNVSQKRVVRHVTLVHRRHSHRPSSGHERFQSGRRWFICGWYWCR